MVKISVYLEDLETIKEYRRDTRLELDVIADSIDLLIREQNIRRLLDEYYNLRTYCSNLDDWDRRLDRTVDDRIQSRSYTRMIRQSLDRIVDYFQQSSDGGINNCHLYSKMSSLLSPSSQSMISIVQYQQQQSSSYGNGNPVESTITNINHCLNNDCDDGEEMEKLEEKMQKSSIQSPPSQIVIPSKKVDEKQREIPKNMDWSKPPPKKYDYASSTENKESSCDSNSQHSSDLETAKLFEYLESHYSEFDKKTNPLGNSKNNLSKQTKSNKSLDAAAAAAVIVGDVRQSKQQQRSSSSAAVANSEQNQNRNQTSKADSSSISSPPSSSSMNNESLVNKKDHKCLFCGRVGHNDYQCNQYYSMEQRQKRADELNLCKRCFDRLKPGTKTHESSEQCKRQIECCNQSCHQKRYTHHSNLCFEFLKVSEIHHSKQNNDKSKQNQQKNQRGRNINVDRTFVRRMD